MKISRKILFCFYLTLYLVIGYSKVPINKDSVCYEILMSKSLVDKLQLPNKLEFINEITISPAKYALISTSNQLYLLSWGQLAKAGNTTSKNISAFDYSKDSILFIIQERELCYFDSVGAMQVLYNLPNNNMGISCGDKIIYLYDRNNLTKKNALYGLSEGGKYFKILEQESPISDVVEMNDHLYFSSNNFIYDFNLNDKSIKTVISFKKSQNITSMTCDKFNKRLYFSTDNGIYAIKDTTKDIITEKFSGQLRYLDRGLVVFDAMNQSLIRITKIDKLLNSENTTSSKNTKSIQEKTTTPTPEKQPNTTNVKPEPKQQKEILNNESIIKMTKAKLSEDLIIDVIKSGEVNFDLTVESMVNLSKNGVSSNVIKEMKNAMEKKK